jgi:hypothetical protein
VGLANRDKTILWIIGAFGLAVVMTIMVYIYTWLPRDPSTDMKRAAAVVKLRSGPFRFRPAHPGMEYLLYLLGTYTDDVERISKFIIDYKSPITSWLQSAVDFFNHLASRYRRGPPRRRQVRQFFTFLVGRRAVVMNVEKISWHTG